VNANRVALVTGAASGIGRATALLFNERGEAVLAADWDREGLAATARAAAAPDRMVPYEADVSDPARVAAMVQAAVKAFGRLQVLVTAAGIGGKPSSVDRMPDHEWDQVVDISLKGTYLCCREALPQLRRAGGGTIVTFGSVLGRAVLPGGAAYSAAKAGVESLTRALAIDHAREGIRANCVLPGSTDTPLMWAGIPPEELPAVREVAENDVPLGRVAEPVEIARAVWFLASDEASFITGASLAVDGGTLAKASTTY
jgi:meso-butanediol dehydrogenase / (S,S)-butanediol dehydrogenase / diacetyl reductase